jgi:hypothetical protein
MAEASAKRRPASRALFKRTLGPFKTSQTTFDAGEREIEVHSITPHGIWYRLRGMKGEFFITHKLALHRAEVIAAGVEGVSPREGSVRRKA